MTATPMQIADFVAERAKTSTFYGSLQRAMETYGELTQRQLECVFRDMEKAAPAAKPAPRASFDLTTVFAMFERASAKLKVPAYRAAGLVLTRAKPESANPGCIYVKRDDGAYLGKIQPGGEFRSVRECTGDDLDHLREIEAAPGEAAVRWGRMTGRCSCCGRTLSDPVSIANGIGPICAATWGI